MIGVPLLRFLYNTIVIPTLKIAFHIGGLVSAKLAERVHGERETWMTLTTLEVNHKPRIWFHAASMGEFEQVKSIIELLKQTNSDSQRSTPCIIISFFSPSGYRTQLHYSFADAVVYLPLDSRANARRFVGAIKPDVVVFARYDLWLNHIEELRIRSIPTLLVCATLNEHSLVLRWNGTRSFMRELYNSLATIYTAGASETVKFGRLGVTAPILTTADTRFDRIAEQVHKARERRQTDEISILPDKWFARKELVLVLGSSWQADENMIFPAVQRLRAEGKSIGLIIVPHEPTPETVQRIQKTFYNSNAPQNTPIPLSVFEREYKQKQLSEAEFGNDIVVDSIGKLLQLYAYADCAYIGGGFGVGVHSVAEPAGYGIPLACGKNISRARDAVNLNQYGVLSLLHTVDDCCHWLKTLLENPSERIVRGDIAYHYIHTTTGWSERIAADILYIISSAHP